ncbi:MAG TPA: HD domain-containing protein [Exilispira sp.]|nr:HD domain-containing protein [Exilispira sp.]
MEDAGFKAYLVGGFIRDIILDRKTDNIDVDIATDAHPEDIINIFSKVIPTGIKHGTVTVIGYKNKYEITTFRVDEQYYDLRHPEKVQYVSDIHQDLARRDFTINALAFNPLTKELIDDFGGIEDIQRRIIRTVGNASERFNEDALRMLRAIRFSANLMFEIEEDTIKQIRKNSELLLNISKERIREEFNRLILSDKPSFGIELLRQTNILNLMIPSLVKCYGQEQNDFHQHDVYYHLLYSCDAAPKDVVLRLAALFHDIGKPISLAEYKQKGMKENVFYNHELYSEQIAKSFLTEYKYSKDEINIITKLIRYHMFHYTPTWTDGAVRRFVAKVGEDFIPLLFALRVADRIGNGKNFGYPKILLEFWDKINHVINENHALKVTDLAINGNEIMQRYNIKPSKIVGKILNQLLEFVLDDNSLNTKEKLFELADLIFDNIKKSSELIDIIE